MTEPNGVGAKTSGVEGWGGGCTQKQLGVSHVDTGGPYKTDWA